jgi:hypothetical protein
MKKFALTLITATAISGAQAEIGSGLYVGVNGALNAFNADAKITNLITNTTQKVDMGRHRAGTGMYTGYGISSNCLYYAFEIGYQFVNANFRFMSTNPSIIGKFQHRHQFNFAVRAGFKFTPSTVAYVRLGGNWGQYKAKTNVALMNDTKSRISFAPAIGAETSLGRNWVGRIECMFETARTFKRTVPNAVKMEFDNVYTSSTKLGVAYKF